MFTFPAMHFGNPRQSLTLIGTANGNDTTTVDIPSSAQIGDLAILFDTCTQTATVNTVVPSGFTQLKNDYSDQQVGTIRLRTITSYRVLTASGAATVTGINTSAGAVSKALILLRPTKSITAVTLSGNNFQVAASTVADQTIASSGGTAPLIALAQWKTNNTGTYLTKPFSPSEDGEVSAYSAHSLKYKIYNSSPADITVQRGTISGTNSYYALESFYVQVT